MLLESLARVMNHICNHIPWKMVVKVRTSFFFFLITGWWLRCFFKSYTSQILSCDSLFRLTLLNKWTNALFFMDVGLFHTLQTWVLWYFSKFSWILFYFSEGLGMRMEEGITEVRTENVAWERKFNLDT